MKERRKKILLGSLQISDQLNWLPYASGCLISYAKRQPGINESYEFLDPLYQFRSDIANYGNELQSADILGELMSNFDEPIFIPVLSEMFSKALVLSAEQNFECSQPIKKQVKNVYI